MRSVYVEVIFVIQVLRLETGLHALFQTDFFLLLALHDVNKDTTTSGTRQGLYIHIPYPPAGKTRSV